MAQARQAPQAQSAYSIKLCMYFVDIFLLFRYNGYIDKL